MKNSTQRRKDAEAQENARALDWIAQYVICIATLPGKGITLEVTAASERADGQGEDQTVITRRGKTHLEALRNCVRYGMKHFPEPRFIAISQDASPESSKPL